MHTRRFVVALLAAALLLGTAGCAPKRIITQGVRWDRVARASAHPEEDQAGWNCFKDGNRSCGKPTAIVKLWHQDCYIYRPYVHTAMCPNGANYYGHAGRNYVVSDTHGNVLFRG